MPEFEALKAKETELEVEVKDLKAKRDALFKDGDMSKGFRDADAKELYPLIEKQLTEANQQLHDVRQRLVPYDEANAKALTAQHQEMREMIHQNGIFAKASQQESAIQKLVKTLWVKFLAGGGSSSGASSSTTHQETLFEQSVMYLHPEWSSSKGKKVCLLLDPGECSFGCQVHSFVGTMGDAVTPDGTIIDFKDTKLDTRAQLQLLLEAVTSALIRANHRVQSQDIPVDAKRRASSVTECLAGDALVNCAFPEFKCYLLWSQSALVATISKHDAKMPFTEKNPFCVMELVQKKHNEIFPCDVASNNSDETDGQNSSEKGTRPIKVSKKMQSATDTSGANRQKGNDNVKEGAESINEIRGIGVDSTRGRSTKTHRVEEMRFRGMTADEAISTAFGQKLLAVENETAFTQPNV